MTSLEKRLNLAWKVAFRRWGLPKIPKHKMFRDLELSHFYPPEGLGSNGGGLRPPNAWHKSCIPIAPTLCSSRWAGAMASGFVVKSGIV